MPLRATRAAPAELVLPAALEPLRELAFNLRWTWDTDTLTLFRRLGDEQWQASGHNPVRLLQQMPQAELERLTTDQGFLAHLSRARGSFDRYMSRPAATRLDGMNASWGGLVAYFSMEFGLAECLPGYAGGLGVLAGDHLKSASDLGLPLVGVSLLYREGYFTQSLLSDGWQTEEYPEEDFWSQPIQLVHAEDGQPLTVSVPFAGRDVQARVWVAQVGHVRLFLLDADVDWNSAADRAITARLYAGDLRLRLQQEMLLGIGGIRALEALGLRPAVSHMNEGHSALLGLERMRLLMAETGASFEEARAAVSAASVFTTHTAVAAGIDLVPPALVRDELGAYCAATGLDIATLIALGRINAGDESEPFSMALLGLRLSGFRNAVSQAHRGVSQRLWQQAWPGTPTHHAPIEAITNGVHLPTWVAPEIAGLYDRYLGAGWRDDPCRAELWGGIEQLPEAELWEAHECCRARLIQHANAATPAAAGAGLRPDVLTLGFARRFASYKRATLLFRDSGRLAQIVNDPNRPVQLIFSGKAHPRDDAGKELMQSVVEQSRRPEFRGRIVVLEGYDMALARLMVQGCDLWLNTPVRPLEASGTSGMKAVVNGVLHASVPDGWWAEAYRPGLGWAIGADESNEDQATQDALDAEAIYDLLEGEAAPLFYERSAGGVPPGWTAMMKRAIAAFAPVFNTSRMVSEYAARAYLPAARSWTARDGHRPALAAGAHEPEGGPAWQEQGVTEILWE